MTKEEFIKKVNDLRLYSSGNSTEIGLNYLKLNVGSYFNEYNNKYKKRT